MELIQRRISGRISRTYGFEYELLGERPLSPRDLSDVKGCLPSLGFTARGDRIADETGMYITFEPGGQLEFSSPPIPGDDMALFDSLLNTIGTTVAAIRDRTGVNYIPVEYIPGRDSAPMLLEADRYRSLHELLGKTSDRGREMMKGTAAIHLHVSLNSMDELLRLWEFMCSLSREEGFAMGPDRRDIWDRTDPSRCGLTCSRADNIRSSGILLERLILFALDAIDLHAGIPFGDIYPHPGFKDFLEHFTTIFTDVRLNTKGITLELRTPDTRPLHMFRGAWITFLHMVQRMMDGESVHSL